MSHAKPPLAALAIVLLTACRTASPPAAVPAQSAAVQTHENLNAVIWWQASPEFRATTIQAFATAERMLPAALADRTWTAAVEQTGDFAALPPAVIVDVDETVLDNSAYEARLIRGGGHFELGSWNAWVREEQAPAIPGAAEFARSAARQGVTIFYISNREAEVEDATRRNLVKVGFPVTDGVDVLMFKNEKPEWSSSDKTSRRREVASRYRVLLLIGDNMGDFIADSRIPQPERLTQAEQTRDRWGVKWFMIPNPMYGNWVGAVQGHGQGLTHEEQLRRRYDALRTQQ
jgi:acid phosphatase